MSASRGEGKARRVAAWTLAMGLGVPAAVAGPPVPFDNWNAPGGNIDAPCPNGYSCEINVNAQGILQRMITAPDGRRYIQLILTSDGPMGRLRDESFVRADNVPEGGIAAKQTMDTTGSQGEQLTSTTVLNTGWAMTPGQAAVELTQRLVDTTPEGVQFDQYFQKLIDQDANGVAIGYYMDIRQDIINSSLLNGVTLGPNDQDVHAFVVRQAQGTRQPTALTVTLPGGGMMGGGMGGGGMGGGMMGGGIYGGTLSWNQGDEVRAAWVGQICTGACRSGGMMGGGMMGGGGMGGGMGMMGGGQFMWQAYDNLSDAAPQIMSRSIFSTAPFDWQDPPFGPQPGI